VCVCNSFEDAADIRTLEMWRRKPDPLGANLGKLRGTDDDLRAPKLCLQIEPFGALHNIVPLLPGDNLKSQLTSLTLTTWSTSVPSMRFDGTLFSRSAC
jgi:hypothetical protein